MISAYPTDDGGSPVDTRVVKLVAVCTISAACFILFALPRLGMFLNKALALFKVVLLLVVISKGAEIANGSDSAFSDSSHSGTKSFIDNMSAFVYIIYSYTGWENANYVSPGEERYLLWSNNRRSQERFVTCLNRTRRASCCGDRWAQWL